MPKKYLLYIHDSDRFDALKNRGEKSQLVNGLLDLHWKNGDRVKLAIKPGVIHGPEIIKDAEAVKRAVQGTAGGKVDACPHGFAEGMCKFSKCNNKYKKPQDSAKDQGYRAE